MWLHENVELSVKQRRSLSTDSTHIVIFRAIARSCQPTEIPLYFCVCFSFSAIILLIPWESRQILLTISHSLTHSQPMKQGRLSTEYLTNLGFSCPYHTICRFRSTTWTLAKDPRLWPLDTHSQPTNILILRSLTTGSSPNSNCSQSTSHTFHLSINHLNSNKWERHIFSELFGGW